MSANPLGDVFGEIGKVVMFLIGLYYSLMSGFHSWISVSVGVPAAFLVTALIFVILPCMLLYILASYAVSSTYSVLELSWSWLLRGVLLTIVVFLILYAMK